MSRQLILGKNAILESHSDLIITWISELMPYSFPQINLEPDEIHLWFAYPDEITAPHLLAEYKKIMNEEESKRQQRFHFERHRHQYLITRLLARSVLSHYADVSPLEWSFSKNKYGKPEIVRREGMPNIRFNLTHTDSLIFCGVTLDKDLGVDVENLHRNGETVGIADRFFSPYEVQEMLSLPEDQQKNRFFDYWTLKESYIKACGMGLSIPLDHFYFRIQKDQPLQIGFDHGRVDFPNDWKFWILEPSPFFKSAVGIRCGEGSKPYRLISRRAIPLVESNLVSYPIIKSS